jgi:aminopeptidase N
MPHNCCQALHSIESTLLQGLEDAAIHSSSSLAAAGGEFASEAALPSYAPHLVIEPIHMAIDLTFDVPNYKAFGSVTHTFKSNHTSTSISASTASASSQSSNFSLAPHDLLKTVTLNAASLNIKSVTGANVSHHTYNGLELQIYWLTPFESGEERQVKIDYEIYKPVAGMYFNVADKSYPDRVTHMITDHESERARYWLPCIDYPVVRTSLGEFSS